MLRHWNKISASDWNININSLIDFAGYFVIQNEIKLNVQSGNNAYIVNNEAYATAFNCNNNVKKTTEKIEVGYVYFACGEKMKNHLKLKNKNIQKGNKLKLIYCWQIAFHSSVLRYCFMFDVRVLNMQFHVYCEFEYKNQYSMIIPQTIFRRITPQITIHS